MRTLSNWGNLARRALLAGALAAPAIGHGDDSNCTGFCANDSTRLTKAQVGRIISQAVGEARARGKQATIAVVDRVGNVLGVYQTRKAQGSKFTIRSSLFYRETPPKPVKIRNGQVVKVKLKAGLEELNVLPSTLAAIAKAITGAYLSSEGNAFSTRTANQIIQQSFNPREIGQPSGPLFGVQFSSLPCGDLVQHGAGPGIGPRASPLGLSADAGGLPLYMNGTVVGAIGVMSDGQYGIDTDIFDFDKGQDELIATAGTFGFAAPSSRRADQITAGGLLLRFSNTSFKDLASNPANAPPFSRINDGRIGSLVDAATGADPSFGFFVAANGLQEGTAFGTPASGIEPAKNLQPNPFPGLDAFVLTDGASNNRYPPIDGAPNARGLALTANEVAQVLRNGLGVANGSRAQIRRPLSTPVRVTLSVVDQEGAILGVARTRDAPVFGIDVSLQKARTAALFSRGDAGGLLRATPAPVKNGQFKTLGHYVSATQNFVLPPYAGSLLDDGTAFSNRAIGNLARPSFPDGILRTPHGPLSKPFAASGDLQGVFRAGASEWTPFNDGIQLDLVINNLAGFLIGATPPGNCAMGLGGGPNGSSIAPNGIQIFPGSVPIYKQGTLVGAIGISGDGVDQDDMVGFLGVQRAGAALGGSIGEAPRALRADNVKVDAGKFNEVNLRYVQCPFAPFIDSTQQTPCGDH